MLNLVYLPKMPERLLSPIMLQSFPILTVSFIVLPRIKFNKTGMKHSIKTSNLLTAGTMSRYKC